MNSFSLMSKKSFLRILLLIGLIVNLNQPAGACTSVLVSGKHTKSGFPILLKQRDASDYFSFVGKREGTVHSYMGVFSTKFGRDYPLCGVNSVDFCIINTATYNLGNRNIEGIDPTLIMREALFNCSSVGEFESYLTKVQRNGMTVPSNFGVMDRQGNCCYYEVSSKAWKKYDVNDETIAPSGYMVCTNFSWSGDSLYRRGYKRYMTSCHKIEDLIAHQRKIDVVWLTENICRSSEMVGRTGNRAPRVQRGKDVELNQEMEDIANANTSFAVAFQCSGNPEHTAIMWTLLGSPMVTPAIPVALSMPVPDYMSGRTSPDRKSEVSERSFGFKQVLFSDELKSQTKESKRFKLKEGGGSRRMHLLETKMGKRYDRILRQKDESKRNRMLSVYYADYYRKLNTIWK